MKFVPIIQAPMAGVSTPKLAAAVSNAGGIGSLGLAGQSLPNVRKQIEQTQALTSNPINVNFFEYAQPQLQTAANQQWIKALDPLFQSAHLEPPQDLKPVYSPVSSELIQALLEFKPAIASFHLGTLSPQWTSQLQANGIKVWVTATNVDEAVQAESSGANGVVVQGIEAGGHRGTFDPSDDSGMPTLELVRRVKAQLTSQISIIAAGGIMNGQDIRNALNAGANMVQLGTAFIVCPESSASESYRSKVLSTEPTVLHNVVSGRYARGFRNEFVDFALKCKDAPAPFPYAYDAQKMLAAQDSRFVNHWAGLNHSSSRAMPAPELVRLLSQEAGL